MKQKKIQLIINIITIINIILIALIGYHMIINHKYSRKFAYDLASKNMNSDNYILEREENSIKDGQIRTMKIMRKGEVRKEVLDTGLTTWYANDFVIRKDGEDKYYYKEETSSIDINGNEKVGYMTTKETLKALSLQNDFRCYWSISGFRGDSPYQYLKKEKYNDKNCIVIKIGDESEETEYYIIWLDLETGFIVKEETYSKGVLTKITNYKIEINVVTDEKMDLPNLDEYKFKE